jgi:hypothetical protein
MTFGTAIHETMQNYLEVMYNKNTAVADRINIEEYFEERLRAVYKEDYKKKEKEWLGFEGALNKIGLNKEEVLDRIKKGTTTLQK